MRRMDVSPFSEWRFPLGRVDFCNSAESVCLSVCPRTFVNNSGTEGRIRTRQTPKDAPKRRNDDGVCHVAPRATCATCHVPPREPLAKQYSLDKVFEKKVVETRNFQSRCTPVGYTCHVSDDPEGQNYALRAQFHFQV